MSVLIAYRSRYGSVFAVAQSIAGRLSVDSQLADLRERHVSDLSEFRAVLIGASIYAGRVQKEVPRFCETHQAELLARPVGVFLSCFYEGAEAEAQLADSFPAWLLAHAFGRYFVGGRVQLDRLRFIDKLLLTRIAGISSDTDRIRPEVIQQIARDLMRAIE